MEERLIFAALGSILCTIIGSVIGATSHLHSWLPGALYGFCFSVGITLWDLLFTP